MKRPPLLPRHESLGYEVNHLARMLADRLRVRTQPLGVVPGQFAQLLALYERDGLTQAELCHIVRIEQATMANTLKRMERDGLITRISDPHDGRRSLVKLTPRAMELQEALVTSARELNRAATRGLSESEISAFFSTLQRIVANLDGAGSDSQDAIREASR